MQSLNLIFHNQHQCQLVYQAINSKRESIYDVDGLHIYARTTYVVPAQIDCAVLFALGRFLLGYYVSMVMPHLPVAMCTLGLMQM